MLPYPDKFVSFVWGGVGGHAHVTAVTTKDLDLQAMVNELPCVGAGN